MVGLEITVIYILPDKFTVKTCLSYVIFLSMVYLVINVDKLSTLIIALSIISSDIRFSSQTLCSSVGSDTGCQSRNGKHEPHSSVKK